MAAVIGTEQVLCGVVQDAGVVRRQDDRHRPGVAILLFAGIVAIRVIRPLHDVLRLIRVPIEACDAAKIGSGINNTGIAWIHGNVAALSSAYGIPIGTIDKTAIASRQYANGGIILLCAVNGIREIVVRCDVVELRGRLIILRGPVLATVYAYGGPAVVGVDHPIG